MSDSLTSRKYEVYNTKKPLNRNHKPKAAKLKKNLQPGSVVILLSGRYRGHKAVFLRQLPSGLLLVSGPWCLNGVPLRRVNQAYVVVTSTKVDVSGVNIPEGVSDAYFKKEAKASRKSAKSFMDVEASSSSNALPAFKKDNQKAVDAALMKSVTQVPLLKEYLKAKFSLRSGQFPHMLKF